MGHTDIEPIEELDKQDIVPFTRGQKLAATLIGLAVIAVIATVGVIVVVAIVNNVAASVGG